MSQMYDHPDVEGASPRDTTPAAAAPTPPQKRSPGHRGQDIRDTMAELAAKAQEISQEAGSKMAAALRDVIGAAAGISEFAIESARELVQYMVRRGQMTQEEADKLIREAEEAKRSRPKAGVAATTAVATVAPRAKPAGNLPKGKGAKPAARRPAKGKAVSKSSAVKKAAARKPAAKTASRPAAKK